MVGFANLAGRGGSLSRQICRLRFVGDILVLPFAVRVVAAHADLPGFQKMGIRLKATFLALQKTDALKNVEKT